MQLNHCQSPEAKTLLSHPFGAWLLLFPGFVTALAKGITIACERRRARKQNLPSAAARINKCFLKDYYKTNLKLSKAIEYLGLDLGSSLSVVGLASGMVAVAKAGLRGSILDTAQAKTNHELGKRVGSILGMSGHGARSLGVQAAMVTIFAGILHAQFINSRDQAKRELLARGLLMLEEI